MDAASQALAPNQQISTNDDAAEDTAALRLLTRGAEQQDDGDGNVEAKKPEASRPEPKATSKPEDKADDKAKAPGRMEEIRRKATEAREKRRSAERAVGEEAEVERLRSESKALQAKAQSFDDFLAEAKKDPAAAFSKLGGDPRQLLDILTKATLEPEKHQADGKIEALQKRLDESEKRSKEDSDKRQAAEMQVAQRRAEEEFGRISDNPEDFPLLSLLDRESRVEDAERIAVQFARLGERVTLNDVAKTMEENLADTLRFFGDAARENDRLREHLVSLLGVDGWPRPKTVTARPTRRTGSTTLSGADASKATAHAEPETDEDLDRAARELLLG